MYYNVTVIHFEINKETTSTAPPPPGKENVDFACFYWGNG